MHMLPTLYIRIVGVEQNNGLSLFIVTEYYIHYLQILIFAIYALYLLII